MSKTDNQTVLPTFDTNEVVSGTLHSRNPVLIRYINQEVAALELASCKILTSEPKRDKFHFGRYYARLHFVFERRSS